MQELLYNNAETDRLYMVRDVGKSGVSREISAESRLFGVNEDDAEKRKWKPTESIQGIYHLLR